MHNSKKKNSSKSKKEPPLVFDVRHVPLRSYCNSHFLFAETRSGKKLIGFSARYGFFMGFRPLCMYSVPLKYIYWLICPLVNLTLTDVSLSILYCTLQF
jgi:hypothetical protein